MLQSSCGVRRHLSGEISLDFRTVQRWWHTEVGAFVPGSVSAQPRVSSSRKFFTVQGFWARMCVSARPVEWRYLRKYCAVTLGHTDVGGVSAQPRNIL